MEVVDRTQLFQLIDTKEEGINEKSAGPDSSFRPRSAKHMSQG